MRNPNYSANTGDSQSWEFRSMTDQFSHFICKETDLQEGKVTFSRHTAKKSHHLHSSLTSGSYQKIKIKKSKLYKFSKHIGFLRSTISPIRNNLVSKQSHIPPHCHCMHKYIIQHYTHLSI